MSQYVGIGGAGGRRVRIRGWEGLAVLGIQRGQFLKTFDDYGVDHAKQPGLLRLGVVDEVRKLPRKELYGTRAAWYRLYGALIP